MPKRLRDKPEYLIAGFRASILPADLKEQMMVLLVTQGQQANFGLIERVLVYMDAQTVQPQHEAPDRGESRYTGLRTDVQVIQVSAAGDAQCSHARNQNKLQWMAILGRQLCNLEMHHSIAAPAFADMEHSDLAMKWKDSYNLEIHDMAIGESEFEDKVHPQPEAIWGYSHSFEISGDSTIVE